MKRGVWIVEERPHPHFNRWVPWPSGPLTCSYPSKRAAEEMAKRIGAYGKSLRKAYRATFVPAAELTRKPRKRRKR